MTYKELINIEYSKLDGINVFAFLKYSEGSRLYEIMDLIEDVYEGIFENINRDEFIEYINSRFKDEINVMEFNYFKAYIRWLDGYKNGKETS